MGAAITLVDGLTTLKVMGLDEEFAEAASWAERNLTSPQGGRTRRGHHTAVYYDRRISEFGSGTVISTSRYSTLASAALLYAVYNV